MTTDDPMSAPGPLPSGARLMVIGEALVDIVHRLDGRVEEMPGGSPANVALALGRLGHRPTLVTQLADDRHGRTVRRWLEASDVDVLASTSTRTSTATARLDAFGAAEYDFDLDWAVTLGTPDPVDLVHAGSIAALLDPGAIEVVRAVRELRGSAVVTYDPNVRPALLGDRSEVRGRIEQVVALADLVKASDEDLAWLYPGVPLVEVAKTWQASGPVVVVVTSGASGALAVTEQGVWEVEAPLVEVADTVGAGDTFMAALIDVALRLGVRGAAGREALRHIGSSGLTGMLERAARAAAITVSRPGADPPTAAELEAADLAVRRATSASDTPAGDRPLV